MKLFQRMKNAEKQFTAFVEENQACVTGLWKTSFKERFANVLALIKTGGSQISHTPEIIIISLIRLILTLGVVALIVYNISFFMDISPLSESSQDQGSNPLFMLFYLPLLYLFSFIGGVSNGAVGVASFLHQTRQKSTLVKCYQISLQNSGALSSFMFMNNFIMILTGRNNEESSAGKSIMRFMWHVGTMGVLPALLNGRSFTEAFKRSFSFFKHKVVEVVSIRLAYNLLLKFICLVPIFFIALFASLEQRGVDVLESVPLESSDALVVAAWSLGGWSLLLVSFLIIIRPIYISVVYHLYGQFLQENNYSLEISDDKPISKTVWFAVILVLFYALVPTVFPLLYGNSS